MHRMHRSLALPLLLILLVTVAACGSSSSPTLTDHVWILSSFSADVPGTLVQVDHPESYTITFKTDGTFSARADCNQVAGQYTTSDGGAMTITPGPSTMAACPAGSKADQYVAALAAVSAYHVTDRQLSLTTTNGTMTFS